MTARDAIDRLNRSFARPEKTLERVPSDYIERMFDLDEPSHRVCRHFPGCLCGEECIDLRVDSPIARTVQTILIVATALVGLGLLYVGLRG